MKKNKLTLALETNTETECFQQIVKIMIKNKLIADTEIPIDSRLARKQAESIYFLNTKKLLYNYRDILFAIRAHLELTITAVSNKSCDCSNASIQELLSIIKFIDNNYEYNSKFVCELETIKRSLNMLLLINNSIELIKKKQLRGKILYDIIKFKFIDDRIIDGKSITPAEFCIMLGIKKRTYHNYLNEAYELISTILWSGPNVSTCTLIDVATILSYQNN